MFEFTYERYEDRMKKKTAEMREMREREADERRAYRARAKRKYRRNQPGSEGFHTAK
jgi:hypothetical protein